MEAGRRLAGLAFRDRMCDGAVRWARKKPGLARVTAPFTAGKCFAGKQRFMSSSDPNQQQFPPAPAPAPGPAPAQPASAPPPAPEPPPQQQEVPFKKGA